MEDWIPVVKIIWRINLFGVLNIFRKIQNNRSSNKVLFILLQRSHCFYQEMETGFTRILSWKPNQNSNYPNGFNWRHIRLISWPWPLLLTEFIQEKYHLFNNALVTYNSSQKSHFSHCLYLIQLLMLFSQPRGLRVVSVLKGKVNTLCAVRNNDEAKDGKS